MSVRAFALSDGAAGNAKQAAALAGLLGLEYSAHTLQINGQDRWLAPRFKAASTERTLVDSAQSLAAWLGQMAPDLAIGCGRIAAAALRAIKQLRPSCKTVQILAPECSPAYFDWVVCPQHDALRGTNVLTSLGAIHSIECQLPAISNQSSALLLLLGQPNKNAAWTQKQLRTLLLELSAWPGEIKLSTSRRSDFDIRALIAESPLRLHPQLQIYQAGSAPNPYLDWLLSARQIVVTPDSVNMLSEAMATRAQLFVPWQSATQGKIARFLQANRQRFSALTTSNFAADSPQAAPLADCLALARTLKRKLGLS